MKFEEIADRHYRLVDIEHSIEFDVRRLHYERHELFAELAVSCGILGAAVIDGTLSIGSINLSSPRARHDRAKILTERARTKGQVDWIALLEEVCQCVLLAERRGRPAVLLRDILAPQATESSIFTVCGFMKITH